MSEQERREISSARVRRMHERSKQEELEHLRIHEATIQIAWDRLTNSIHFYLTSPANLIASKTGDTPARLVNHDSARFIEEVVEQRITEWKNSPEGQEKIASIMRQVEAGDLEAAAKTR